MNAYLVMGAISILLLLFLVLRIDNLAKAVINWVNNPKDKIPDDGGIDKEEFERLRLYSFYDKTGNVPFTNERTVTLASTILQLTKEEKTETTSNINPEEKFEKNTAIGRVDHIGSLRELDDGIPLYDMIEFDLDELRNLEYSYEEHLCDIIGENALGILCPCPGKKWCPWKKEALAQYLISTSWNLKSIEIFKQTRNEVKKISEIKKKELSPDGKYLFVTMSNIKAIKSLEPGAIVFIVFTILNKNGKPQSLVVQNRIPALIGSEVSA